MCGILWRASKVCENASNHGSDSHLMMFMYGLGLFRENQHHAIQLSGNRHNVQFFP
jgi:hypothetical protein